MIKKIIALNLVRIMVITGAFSALSPTTAVGAVEEVKVNKTNLTLIKGVNKTIQLDYVPGTVAVGSSEKVDFKSLRTLKQLHLIAKEPGVTNITIRDTSGKVRDEIFVTVTISNLAGVMNDLQNLMKGIEGIDLKLVGNKIMIDGEILLPSDFNRIIAVVQEYGSEEVGIIASLSPIAQKIIAKKMEQDLTKSLGGENAVTVSVRSLNQQFIIEGLVPSGDLKSRATKIAESYVPEIFSEYGEREKIISKFKPPRILNLLVVKAPPKPEKEPTPPPPPPRLIKVTTYFVELNKNYKKGFSFKWAPGLSEGSNSGVGFEIQPGTSGIFSRVTGTIKGLLPQLNRAKELGHARVLQTHTLLITEKKEGRIENVEKIPYTVVTQEGQGTEFVDVGLITSLKPTISEGDPKSVEIEVKFQFNSAIPGSGGAPRTQNKTVSTTLVMKSGQSAAIGGLFGNDMSLGFNKQLPSTTGDPIINLLRSKDFNHSKNQFVIFVSPEIVDDAQEASKEMKQKFTIGSVR